MSRVYDFGLGGQFPDSSTKFLLHPNGALLYPNGSSSLGRKISDGTTCTRVRSRGGSAAKPSTTAEAAAPSRAYPRCPGKFSLCDLQWCFAPLLTSESILPER
jgi:hypothetical protein